MYSSQPPPRILVPTLLLLCVVSSSDARADYACNHTWAFQEPTPCDDGHQSYADCVSWCASACDDECTDTDCSDCDDACEDAHANCAGDCGACDPFPDSTVDDTCEDIGYCFDPADYASPPNMDDWGPASFDTPWATAPHGTNPQGLTDVPSWTDEPDVEADPQSVFAIYLLPPLFAPIDEPSPPAALPTEPATAGDPVQLGSGAQVVEVTDLRFAGPVQDLAFTRRYVSNSDDRSVLGSNWTFEYDTFLESVTPSSAHTWAPAACRAEEPEVDSSCPCATSRRCIPRSVTSAATAVRISTASRSRSPSQPPCRQVLR